MQASTGLYEQQIEVMLGQTDDLEREIEALSYKSTTSSKDEPALVKKLQAQIELFLKRKNNEYVKTVFLQYADKKENLILPDNFHAALTEFGVHLTSEEVSLLMTSMDTED